MLVLCGKLNEFGRRSYDTWFLGLVKNTDTLYKGEVQLETYPHDARARTFPWKVERIRIIEKPQLRFKKVGSNYRKVPKQSAVAFGGPLYRGYAHNLIGS